MFILSRFLPEHLFIFYFNIVHSFFTSSPNKLRRLFRFSDTEFRPSQARSLFYSDEVRITFDYEDRWSKSSKNGLSRNLAVYWPDGIAQVREFNSNCMDQGFSELLGWCHEWASSLMGKFIHGQILANGQVLAHGSWLMAERFCPWMNWPISKNLPINWLAH